jgi:hypothetical protein
MEEKPTSSGRAAVGAMACGQTWAEARQLPDAPWFRINFGRRFVEYTYPGTGGAAVSQNQKMKGTT